MKQVNRLLPLTREVLQVIFGPRPLTPGFIFITFTLVFHISAIGRYAGSSPLLETNLSGLPASVVSALALAIPIWLSNRLRKKRQRALSRRWYLTTLVSSALIASLVRIYVLSFYGTDMTFALPLILGITFRLVIVSLILLSIAGVYGAKLREQVESTQAALVLVQEQRTALFNAEEQARSSVSEYLHDRVQASLVAVGMQLRALTTHVDSEVGKRIGSLAEEVEKIRADDVRVAARLLSPDLRTFGLTGAFNELGATYAPAIEVEVNNALSTETEFVVGNSVVGISLFRTAEQALLNSAVHGNATRVQVTLASETNGVLLTITDNGFGLSAGPILRGRGSLLMDSATQAVGGNWSLRTAEGEGAILTAHFPLGGS